MNHRITLPFYASEASSRTFKKNNPDCKIVLVVDENTEKKLADRVRQAKKTGLKAYLTPPEAIRRRTEGNKVWKQPLRKKAASMKNVRFADTRMLRLRFRQQEARQNRRFRPSHSLPRPVMAAVCSCGQLYCS